MKGLGNSVRRRRRKPRAAPKARKRGRWPSLGKAGRPRKADRPGKETRRPANGTDRDRRALRRPLQVLLTAAAGLGAGYLVAVLVLFPIPDVPLEIQVVPDLRAQTLDAAVAALADSGLSVSRIDSVRHPGAAPGRVIGQSPLPGPTALAGGAVRITVSSGPEVRPVPDLTRLVGGRAAELLGAAGFVVHIDTLDAMLPVGRVLGLDPAPGTEVQLPADVRLMVSRGPPTVDVPDLAGLTAGEAFALLRARGLALGDIERRYSLLNVNFVFGQHPGSGELAVQGSRVRIIVGREMRQP